MAATKSSTKTTAFGKTFVIPDRLTVIFDRPGCSSRPDRESKILKTMKKNILSALAICAALFGCQKNEISETRPSGVELHATIEDDASTKTVMDENNNIRWSEGDQIIAFMKSSYGHKYQVKSSFIGETYADFSKVSSSNGDDLSAGMDWDHIVAYYPYAESIKCAKSGNNYALNVVLPFEQTYAAESFGNGFFPMVAVSENNNITFKNVLGGMKLQLRGTQKVKSIKLEGRNGEKLSGKAIVTAYTDGTVPAINMASDASTSVTLNCGSGIQLNEDTATEFIISLPPVTFTKGFTVTITDTAGGIQTIETSKENVVLRSSLLKMPEVEVKTELKDIPNNQIWYTAAEKVEPHPEYYQSMYEVNVIAHEYDSETQRGVITFEEELLVIPAETFRRSKLKSVIIPKSVNEILYAAFAECTLLSDVKFLNEVGMFIQDFAFFGCSFDKIIFPSDLTTCGMSFSECDNLKEVTFRGSIEIADYGFEVDERCTGNPFAGCFNLERFSGPCVSSDGRCLIPGGRLICVAPYGLETDQYVIPDEVKEIGRQPFINYFVRIVIPESVISIADFAFDYYYHGLYSSLEEIVIGNGVETIGTAAFSNCPNLKNVTLGNNVETIGWSAFSNCPNLKSVTLGNNVKVIGYSAFFGCTELKSITLPASIEEIRDKAFAGTGLTDIYCKAQTPPGIYHPENVFISGIGEIPSFPISSNLKIYVPRSAYDDYKQYYKGSSLQSVADNWYYYEDYIVAYDF